jgi:hypothetical protein
MRYVWKEGDVATRLESEADLERCLARIAEQPAADVSLLCEDEASAPSGQWLYRMLGLKPPTMREGLLLLVRHDEACLTYVDQDWHETRVSDPGRAAMTGDIAFTLETGGSETVPRSECVRQEDAIDAARRFYKGAPRRADFIYKATPEPR